MFAPVSPIRADSRSDVAVDSVLARIDALLTVLHALGRMAGLRCEAMLEGFNQRADLSALLAASDVGRLAYLVCELEAASAALQAGFSALDRARQSGRPGQAAAALLYREASGALATLLTVAGTDTRAT